MRQSAQRPRCSPQRARSVPRPSHWEQTASKPQQNNQKEDTATRLRHVRAIFSPLFFAKELLNFHPEPAQEHVLRNAHFKKRIALNCNRQWGKSTIAAILIAHRLYTQPNSLVLIVAPAGRQAGETFLKVKDFLLHLDQPLTTDRINQDSIVLPNGSRLVCLPAVDGTARGFSSVSLLLFDEAARIKDRVYFAFRPMLAVKQGDLMIISTPEGRSGFFYREMMGLNPKTAGKWFRHTGPVTECMPRITQDFIDEEQSLGEAYFQQEWMCVFLKTTLYTLDELTLHKMIKRELDAFEWL